MSQPKQKSTTGKFEAVQKSRLWDSTPGTVFDNAYPMLWVDLLTSDHMATLMVEAPARIQRAMMSVSLELKILRIETIRECHRLQQCLDERQEELVDVLGHKPTDYVVIEDPVFLKLKRQLDFYRYVYSQWVELTKGKDNEFKRTRDVFEDRLLTKVVDKDVKLMMEPRSSTPMPDDLLDFN